MDLAYLDDIYVRDLSVSILLDLLVHAEETEDLIWPCKYPNSLRKLLLSHNMRFLLKAV